MILIYYISSTVMTVTLKDGSLKQPKQGMLKWTEQQRGKCISLMWKRIPKQHHVFFNSLTVTTSGGKKDDTDSNNDFNNEEDESSDTN